MKNKYLKHLTFGLFVFILVVLAFATILEKLFNTEFVLSNIYHSWWFVLLWAVFGITSFTYIINQSLYKQKASFLLHCSFIIILIGAFVSYISSERGYIHLRQGKPLNSFVLEDEITKKPLPFEIKLVLFEIEYHEGSEVPADFMSFLLIDEEMYRVSLNKILVQKNYRLYQIDYDRDEMGSTLLVTHDPYGIVITYAGYILLAISMLWLLLLRIGWKGALVLSIPTITAWYYISQVNPMTPILRTPMLALHVSVIVISYFILLYIAVTSIMGIASKNKRLVLYKWNCKLLYPALFLLATGIFIGAVWANISWGRYWGWDAKETWALITLLVYAFPMHKRSFKIFTNPLKFHRYCLIAFLTVLMTFLGVSFILGGIHSYL